MADRKASAPDAPEKPQEIVQLDKEDRWQARLEEARARREIALRKKAGKPEKRTRRKPWEEEPGDDPDDFEITPVIQKKPEDEKALDLADRLEKTRNPKTNPPRRAPVKIVPSENLEPAPAPEPEPIARILPQGRVQKKFDEIVPPNAAPEPETAPAPERRSRRDNNVVAPGAPDVIDLAHRYASTLKPPVNVTETLVPEPPAIPEPSPEPNRVAVEAQPVPRDAPNRRPFGLGLAVLLFALVPLTQAAPPLQVGPSPPPTPFFALPPALGLTTSMVWPIEETASSDWISNWSPMALGPVSEVTISPLGKSSKSRTAPVFAGLPLGEKTADPDVAPFVRPARVPQFVSLVIPPSNGVSAIPVVVRAPRPRPVAPDESNDTTSLAPVPLAEKTLRVTILAPTQAQMPRARAMALEAEARGHVLTRIREANLSVSKAHLRYFHGADRAEARRLAGAFGAELRDFTWFEPKPDEGIVELWLAGRPPDPPPAATSDETGALVPENPPTITIVRKKPTLLERLLLGAEGETRIVLPNPSGGSDGAGAASGDN